MMLFHRCKQIIHALSLVEGVMSGLLVGGVKLLEINPTKTGPLSPGKIVVA